MKCRALALSVGLALLGLMPGSALADGPVLDQSNNPAPTFMMGGSYAYAQTFTVGMSGQLDEIDLNLAANHPTAILVQIEGLTGSGVPTETPLSVAATIVNGSAFSWYRFPLAEPFAVAPGDTYAIVFTTTPWSSAAGSSSDYPGGQALMFYADKWQPPTQFYDFAFRTYVQTATATPTPTTTPAPTPTPAPVATSTPTSAPTASSATSEPAASGSPSASARQASTASAVSGATGAPTATTTSTGTSGSGGSTLPIIAALIVVLAVVGGGLWFMRMRR